MDKLTARNREGYDALQVLIPSQDLSTAAVTGAGVRIGANTEFYVQAVRRGTVGNADNVLGVTLEESDDDSTYTALATVPNLTGTVLETEIGVRTTKQYIRSKTAIVTGTTPLMGGVEVYIKS